MINREPYIGMPINLGECDMPSTEPGPVKIQSAEDKGKMNLTDSNANSVAEHACTSKECNAESLDNMPIAMAYVPMQKWKGIYSFEESLSVGTIFPELNLPFMGYKGGMAK